MSPGSFAGTFATQQSVHHAAVKPATMLCEVLGLHLPWSLDEGGLPA